MGHRTTLAAALTSVVLALAGCGGGSVALRSGFPAQGAPPPSLGGAHAGLSVSGGDGLAFALVLGLVVADSVYWLANRLHQGPDDAAPTAAPRGWLQPIDRGWVDRGP
jgi:hypothetical protein